MDPNQGNPISIHIWDDFPPAADFSGYYCKVFDLTMGYFLDTNGMGKSIDNVLNLFYDLRDEVPFPLAFENHFDINIQQQENEYYQRMREYLSKL